MGNREFTFVLLLFVGLSAVCVSEDSTQQAQTTDVGIRGTEILDEEIVVVNVKRAFYDESGKNLEQQIAIKLQVHIIDGIVHVNNIATHHTHVVAIMLLAEIAEVAGDTTTPPYEAAAVVVRIMVKEEPLLIGHRLIVQEEIVQINGQEVTQIDIKEIVIEVDDEKKEVKKNRKVNSVDIGKAEIHGKPRADDHFIRDKRLGENEPYNLGDPELPDKPYHMHHHGDDDDDHHHHHKHGGGLCRKFHRLPLAARIAIFAVIILVTVLTFLGCIHMFCRKKAKLAEKIKAQDFDDKIFMEDDDLEAPPLDKKEPLDKQRLLFVA